MDKKRKNSVVLGLVVGSLGVISGIALIFMGRRLIGVFGAIASAALAYKAYQDWTELKK